MKHVRICHFVTVHFINNDAEERRGPWLLVAVDRHRPFNRRIRQMESILTPDEHRLYIRMSLSANWELLQIILYL